MSSRHPAELLSITIIDYDHSFILDRAFNNESKLLVPYVKKQKKAISIHISSTDQNVPVGENCTEETRISGRNSRRLRSCPALDAVVFGMGRLGSPRVFACSASAE